MLLCWTPVHAITLPYRKQEKRAELAAVLKELTGKVAAAQAELEQYKDNDPKAVQDMRECDLFRRLV